LRWLVALLPLLVLGALVLSAQDALAHAVAQGSDAFTSGFLHPLSLPSHLLNLAALGLLIGQSGLRKWVALAIFCGALLCGLGATARIYVSPTEIWLPVTAGILGGLVAGAWRLPLRIVGAVAVVIGVMLGLDSRPETPFLQDALLMFAGTTLATGLAVLAVAFCVSLAKARWMEIGVRVLGSWIAATAILVSALQFAPLMRSAV
jgi:urease accessory protein